MFLPASCPSVFTAYAWPNYYVKNWYPGSSDNVPCVFSAGATDSEEFGLTE